MLKKGVSGEDTNYSFMHHLGYMSAQDKEISRTIRLKELYVTEQIGTPLVNQFVESLGKDLHRKETSSLCFKCGDWFMEAIFLYHENPFV